MSPQIRETFVSVYTWFLLLTLAPCFTGCSGELQQTKNLPEMAPEIKAVQLPITPPCAIRSMAGSNGHLFLLDSCSTVIKWDPAAGTATVLELEDRPAAAFQLTVASDRLALLDDDRESVWVYDMAGKLLIKHQYVGESFFTRIALTGDTLAASSYYDRHLVRLYYEGAQEPVLLIENPRYWPDLSPRYTLFVEILAEQGRYFAFDLSDFTLYQVDPKSHSIVTIRKDQHPRWQPVLGSAWI